MHLPWNFQPPLTIWFQKSIQYFKENRKNIQVRKRLWESLGLKSSLKEINPEYSSEGQMLKPKLQYFSHLMRRANSLEKTLMLGKIEGRRRYDRGWYGWIASPTQWTWVWANSGRLWKTGKPGVLQAMRSQRVENDLVTEWQQRSN